MVEKYDFAWVVSFEIDFKYWALLPALNINLNFPALEFEWLAFGLYIQKANKE